MVNILEYVWCDCKEFSCYIYKKGGHLKANGLILSLNVSYKNAAMRVVAYFYINMMSRAAWAVFVLICSSSSSIMLEIESTECELLLSTYKCCYLIQER